MKIKLQNISMQKNYFHATRNVFNAIVHIRVHIHVKRFFLHLMNETCLLNKNQNKRYKLSPRKIVQ